MLRFSRGTDVHRLLLTFWSSVGFVGLGAAVLVFGPTLLDLASHLQVGVGVLSAMFGARAAGAAVGGVGSGLAMDYWVKYSYTMMSIIISSCIASTVLIPLSRTIYMLALFMFLNGLATGALDSGTHAILMRLWKGNTGPCMQVVHFCFALGAFIAPIIAKYFISEDRGQSIENSTIASTSNSTEDNGQSNFKFAYWITSTIFLPTLLAFIYFAVKLEFIGYKENMKLSANKTKKCLDDKETELDMDTLPTRSATAVGTKDGCSTEKENFSRDDPDLVSTPPKNETGKYKFVLLILLAIFMFVYVGLEVCFGSLIFTVVVTGVLNFSKSQGTQIQSLFWGTFAFGRIFSILLVVCKVRSSVMISMNLVGSLVAATIMVVFVHNTLAIWLGSAVLGCSYSSIYPTVMTWMSENTKATGVATAILVTGGVLGDVILPAAVGGLVASTSPDILFYMTFVGIILSVVIVVFMFLTAHVRRSELRGYLHVSDVSVKEETVKLMDEYLDESLAVNQSKNL